MSGAMVVNKQIILLKNRTNIFFKYSAMIALCTCKSVIKITHKLDLELANDKSPF